MPDFSYQSLMQAFQQEPGLMEALIMAMHGGRDQGQRAFYNQTRAGLYNSATAPNDGSTYGGIGNGLNTRRALQGYDAMNISRAVLPNLRGD